MSLQSIIIIMQIVNKRDVLFIKIYFIHVYM